MNQCEYVTSRGICPRDAVPPGRFCGEHSATSAQTQIDQYRISTTVLGDSPERHAQANALKSLRGELAILKSAMELRVNICESDAELVASMPALKGQAIAIEKLTATLHNMDVKLGNVLGKTALMTLAQELISIIDSNLRPLVDTTPDSMAVDLLTEKVGREIVAAIASQENSK